jgi:hypothetical protein
MAISTPTTAGQVLTSAYVNNNINSGLVYITEATATSGASISVDNCFTSTYTDYRIVVSRAATTSATGLSLLLRAGGTNTVTNYYDVRVGYDYATSAASVFAVANGTAFSTAIISDTNGASGVIDIFNPKATQRTQYNCQGSDARTAATSLGALSSGGMLNNATSYDGFSITNSNSFTNITVKVYGYRQA